MELLEAKKIVVEAGKRLVSSGLIARTWGNVSCRVDDKHFVITPSGRAYETLTPDEIVLVNIDDLSYEGDIKPSSEKGIHAKCYELRPETNFVIHTHQMYASIISALGYDINGIDGESRDIIGDNIPVSSYGLSGTGKLKNAVVEALKRSDSKAVIMKHHGAVCLGADYDDAFKVASELEKVCERYILDRYEVLAQSTAESFSDVCKYVADVKRRGDALCKPLDAYDSTREGNVVVLKNKDGSEKATIALKKRMLILGDEMPKEAELHCAIYDRREDAGAIVHSNDESVLSASKVVVKKLRPLIDDFAQIAGTTIKAVGFDPDNAKKTGKKVAKAFGKHKNAVLLKDNGAVCIGTSEDEAEATAIVTAKNCKTFVATRMFKEPKYVGAIDCFLENFVYRVKYSKQKNKK